MTARLNVAGVEVSPDHYLNGQRVASDERIEVHSQSIKSHWAKSRKERSARRIGNCSGGSGVSILVGHVPMSDYRLDRFAEGVASALAAAPKAVTRACCSRICNTELYLGRC